MEQKFEIVECIENLAPTTKGENQEIYVELLRKGMKDPKVKNIALSGSYGSGKSSIIQKYISSLSKRDRNKYIEVSLANFDDNEEPEEEEQLIEKSILQQILYKVPKEKLPYSNINRTEEKSNETIWINTIAIIVWLISFFVFIKADIVKNYLLSFFGLQDINIQTLIILFNFIPLVFSSFFIVYIIVRGTGKIKLNKLSFQGINIDLDDKKGSLLNHHIDEILYFFEATDYEVLIIEDLDRQNNTKIFQKLREINTLLNGYTKINKRKKITFVYAVKDSIFRGEERTKFFELIIPVVPIIDPSNAKDKLLVKLEKIGIEIDTNLIKDISYHIFNYRQLTNIVNEFCIYRDIVKEDQAEKLFAIIVYKNLFPEDFSSLQCNKGNLFRVFNDEKEEIINKRLQSIDEEIEVLEERIRNIENEHLENEKELKLIFASKLFEEVKDLFIFADEGSQQITLYEMVNNDKIFHKYVVAGGDLPYFDKNRYSKIFNFRGDKDKKYENRLKILQDKSEEKIQEINKSIDDLKNKRIRTQYSNMRDLLEQDISLLNLLYASTIKSENDKTKNVIKDEEKEDWRTIIQLVAKGYIDENYNRYISYFHEGELTRNDYEFIGKVKNGIQIEYSYIIDNPIKVVEELSVTDFEDPIENFILTEHIFKTLKKQDETKRMKFLETFFNKYSNEFIKNLLEKNIDNELVIVPIIEEAIKKSNFTKIINLIQNDDILIRRILTSTFNENIYENLDEYGRITFHALLGDYIFKIYNEVNNKEKFKKYIREEQVYLPFITEQDYKASQELFEYIYQNSLYDLDYNNIKIVLTKLFDYPLSEEKNLKTKNLTTIRDTDANELINDIDKNIEHYFEGCWEQLDENTEESEETLIYLLNHKELKYQQKYFIMDKTFAKISDIDSIDNKELWKKIFSKNKVIVTWDNVFKYYFENGLDEALFTFLNNEENTKSLSLVRIEEKYFEEHKVFKDNGATKLLRAILENNEFDNINYLYLIESYGYWYKDLDLSKLDDNKVNILIDAGLLMPETEMFDEVFEKSTNCAIRFIEHYKKEYFEGKFEVIFNSDLLLGIVDSVNFTYDEKCNIINEVDVSIIQDNVELQEKIAKLFINNNKKIEEVGLFEALFYNKENKANDFALELLSSQIPFFGTCDKIATYLLEFGEHYKELMEKSRKNLYLDDSSENRQLLNRLKEKDCIGSWKENEGKLKVWRKRS